MNKDEKKESTLHAILAGLLLNGFIQGSEDEQLNCNVLEFAKKEIKKIYDK